MTYTMDPNIDPCLQPTMYVGGDSEGAAAMYSKKRKEKRLVHVYSVHITTYQDVHIVTLASTPSVRARRGRIRLGEVVGVMLRKKTGSKSAK